MGFPHSSVGKESTCNAGDPSLIPGSGKSPGEGIGYPLQYSWASLVAQLVKNLPAKIKKESACNAGDLGSIPGLGRSSGERKGYPLQYSGLEKVTELDMTEQLSFTILPQTPLPSRLPHNIEQGSICYSVGPSWLSI